MTTARKASAKPATVYFTSVRTKPFGTSLLGKLSVLLDRAGFGKLPFERKYVALKIHFGEKGNLAFLRPNFARVIVDKVKGLGGKPFLTDCSTLYVGSRKDAIEHLETAMLNGYVPEVTGCPVIIGDGLKGSDDVEVPVEGGVLLKKALIGRAVMDADIVVSVNHFKGHECVGFGGAVKNLGMGCGSRAGKMAMHCDGVVAVDPKKCVGCGACLKACAHGGPVLKGGKCVISDKCVGCGRCIAACNRDAISPQWSERAGQLDRKTAEYAKAVVQGRPHFHINFVIDVSPFCDCHGESDAPVVPNIGIYASLDPVAVDQACADAVNARQPLPDSVLGESKVRGRDHFGAISPSTDWRLQLEHGERIGLGTRAYKLVEVKVS